MPRVSKEPARPGRLKLLLRRQRRNIRFVAWGLSGFVLMLVGVTLAHSAQRGGAVAALAQSFARAVDMRVQAIDIEGRSNTPENLLQAALGINKGDPILAFSVDAARARIESLSWVQHVAVERRLPGTIHVEITERRPYAIWQTQGKFQLIDRAGAVVTDEDVASFTELPVVVGAGAPAHAAEMITALAAQPDLKPRVEAMVRVGERRWNLQLKNKITIMLPEGHEAAALDRLAILQRDQQILDRPLQFIDMRLPDRLAVRVRAAPDARTPPAKPAPAMAPDPPPAALPGTEAPSRRAT